MGNVVLKVGDKVNINPIYRTEFVQGLVKGKTGTVEDISHYLNAPTYKVRYDEPYTSHGYTAEFDYYYAQEVEKI